MSANPGTNLVTSPAVRASGGAGVDQNGDLIKTMRMITRTYDDLVSESLRQAGFAGIHRGQLVVLQMIENGLTECGPITRQLGTTQQWVSKCLTILTAEGCVERTSDPTDGRRRQISITDHGRRATAIARTWSDRLNQHAPELSDHLDAALAGLRHDAARTEATRDSAAADKGDVIGVARGNVTGLGRWPWIRRSSTFGRSD